VFTSHRRNPDFDTELAQLVNLLNERGGFLDWRAGFDEIVPPNVLGREVRLRLIATNAPGTPNHQLYRAVPKRG
jgi:hypothetical protein